MLYCTIAVAIYSEDENHKSIVHFNNHLQIVHHGLDLFLPVWYGFATNSTVPTSHFEIRGRRVGIILEPSLAMDELETRARPMS